ncbi:hypothetical protein cyc_08565 [Cyclospora cayetanensis]|uniref:Uncharacterized protein n=1 Tax=Cyclospora cayetanensis TaxID=88456 RepID=A0A1D3D6Q7_9EIME|nr:hypothetical protein cyc_08565 [Cyclospora cayetanensis]
MGPLTAGAPEEGGPSSSLSSPRREDTSELLHLFLKACEALPTILETAAQTVVSKAAAHSAAEEGPPPLPTAFLPEVSVHLPRILRSWLQKACAALWPLLENPELHEGALKHVAAVLQRHTVAIAVGVAADVAIQETADEQTGRQQPARLGTIRALATLLQQLQSQYGVAAADPEAPAAVASFLSSQAILLPHQDAAAREKKRQLHPCRLSFLADSGEQTAPKTRWEFLREILAAATLANQRTASIQRLQPPKRPRLRGSENAAAAAAPTMQPYLSLHKRQQSLVGAAAAADERHRRTTYASAEGISSSRLTANSAICCIGKQKHRPHQQLLPSLLLMLWALLLPFIRLASGLSSDMEWHPYLLEQRRRLRLRRLWMRSVQQQRLSRRLPSKAFLRSQSSEASESLAP